MRTSLAYAISVGLHGVIFGALGYAATVYPEFVTIQFAVREGDANGVMSQPRWARRIEATFDTMVAQTATPLAVNVPEPVTSPPRPESLLPMPDSSVTLPPPRELPTVANLDDAPVSSNGPSPSIVQRTGRGPGSTVAATSIEIPRESRPNTVAMIARPTVAETQLESTSTAPTETPETIPDRVTSPTGPSVQPGLASRAASVSVPPLEPGNDDFDALAANSPQGARVSQLPSRLPRNREPIYPEELRRDGIGGTVLLRVTIAADGTVEEVTLAKSSGYRALDESALTAIRTWRFEPARRNKVAVKYTVKLPVTFSVTR